MKHNTNLTDTTFSEEVADVFILNLFISCNVLLLMLLESK